MSNLQDVANKMVDHLNTIDTATEDWYYHAISATGADMFFEEVITHALDPSFSSDLFVLGDGESVIAVRHCAQKGWFHEPLEDWEVVNVIELQDVEVDDTGLYHVQTNLGVFCLAYDETNQRFCPGGPHLDAWCPEDLHFLDKEILLTTTHRLGQDAQEHLE